MISIFVPVSLINISSKYILLESMLYTHSGQEYLVNIKNSVNGILLLILLLLLNIYADLKTNASDLKTFLVL